MGRLLIKFAGLVIAVGLTATVAVVAFTFSLLPELPTVDSVSDVQLKVPLRIFTNRGELIAEFGEHRREPVEIEQVPVELIQAVLAAEDDSFYSHPGVDFFGVVRAAMVNLRSGVTGQGASTITMQVARNYFLSPEKTYTRKLKEVMLAFRLERLLTKNEILELYLNKIFLGHRAYGFAAAARVYYGVPLSDLSVAQLAMLAGLPKAPSRDNPLVNPERAQERRDYVLRRMLKLGYIDQERYELAIAAPVTATKHDLKADVSAPFVAEMVRAHMLERYGEAAYWQGYRVYTTIVGANQQRADEALRSGLKVYDRRHGYRGAVSTHELGAGQTPEDLDRLLESVYSSGELVPALIIAVEDKSATAYTRDKKLVELTWSGLSWARPYVSANRVGDEPKDASEILRAGDIVYVEQLPDDGGWRLSQVPEVEGALVSLRPDDGAIVALTGGFDFYMSKFNRVIQAQRQPGSNIKPFIYSAALQQRFTPASLVSGAPIVVQDETQDSVWRPENYSGKFFGPTRLRRALSLSMNLVSVRLLRAIGPETALAHLERFGLDRGRLPRGLSLALGTGTLTPMELVTAYAVLANGGYRVEPYLIDWVEDADGRVVEQAHPTRACRSCTATPAGDGQTGNAGLRRAPRVLNAGNHFLITSMMQDVIRSGTGQKARQLKRNDLAGKTGTTNDYRDAWFSGFNRDVVTTVWVGFDKPQTLGRGESGAKAALPIWIDYMETALRGSKERFFSPPDNVVAQRVDAESGRAVPDTHPDGYMEYFLFGTQPRLTADSFFRPAPDRFRRNETIQSQTERLF